MIFTLFCPVFAALRRAWQPILWMGLTYVLGVVVGAVMVHRHSGYAEVQVVGCRWRFDEKHEGDSRECQK